MRSSRSVEGRETVLRPTAGTVRGRSALVFRGGVVVTDVRVVVNPDKLEFAGRQLTET